MKKRIKATISNEFELSDAILARRYMEGDQNALCVLIERNRHRIYGFIYSKVQDRIISDDIFQDTIEKIIKTLKSNSYKEEGKFVSWAVRISHNLIVDYFRRSKKTVFQSQDGFSFFSIIPDDALLKEDEIVKGEINNDLGKLVAKLALEQREILEMRIYGGLNFKEIAEIKNISLNTALGRMRYALINMRKEIKKNDVVL